MLLFFEPSLGCETKLCCIEAISPNEIAAPCRNRCSKAKNKFKLSIHELIRGAFLIKIQRISLPLHCVSVIKTLFLITNKRKKCILYFAAGDMLRECQ